MTDGLTREQYKAKEREKYDADARGRFWASGYKNVVVEADRRKGTTFGAEIAALALAGKFDADDYDLLDDWIAVWDYLPYYRKEELCRRVDRDFHDRSLEIYAEAITILEWHEDDDEEDEAI